MFLLIRGFGDVRKCSVRHFTFHDVSINTIPYASSFSVYCPLHSTMFLLILVAILTAELAMLFTFHDVSINTSFKNSTSSVSLFFTFHDVSINTMSDIVLELSQMGLYIPRCFY